MTSPDRVPLTDTIIEQLKHHRDRTKTGPQALIRGKRGTMPDGLTAGLIRTWIDKQVASAREDYLTYVLDEWARLPNAEATKNVKNNTSNSDQKSSKRKKRPPRLRKITAQELDQLRSYRQQGFLPSVALKSAYYVPAGLTASLISRWVNGHTAHARPDYLTFVLQACQALEDDPGRPVVLDRAILDKLNAERARTNIGPQALMSSERGGLATEVDAELIYRWLRGYTKTARKDHIDYVLGLYAVIPDAKSRSTRGKRR